MLTAAVGAGFLFTRDVWVATVTLAVLVARQGDYARLVAAQGDHRPASRVGWSRWGCSWLGRHARELYGAQLRYGHRAGLEAGVAEVAMAMGTVAVLALGAILLVEGQISFAAYPPARVLAVSAFIPLTEGSVPLRMLGQIRAAAIRVRALADAPANVDDTGRTEALPAAPRQVRFDDVSFAYRAADPDALQAVSFTIPAGATVPLVGRSGSGKTTCANLLMRFWDPREGAILVGGVIGIHTDPYGLDLVLLTLLSGSVEPLPCHLHLADTPLDELQTLAEATNGLPEGGTPFDVSAVPFLFSGQRIRQSLWALTTNPS